MMDLKEKAKSESEMYRLLKNWKEKASLSSIKNIVWLEDAQKEIDRLTILLKKYNDEAVKFEDELKQKLQEILSDLDLEDKWHVNPIMNRIRKVVEELLV